MVGRFVEQQHVGTGKQESGERHAHLPAARKTVERLGLHRLVEPESEQDARRPRRGAIGVDRQQALVEVAQPMGVGAMFGLVDQARALGIGGEHRFERTGGAARRFLGDIAEPGAARHFNGAAVGLDLADDRLHQGRFARAVAADQPDPRPRRDRGARAVEDCPPAKAHRDSIDVEHGRAPSKQSWPTKDGPAERQPIRCPVACQSLRKPAIPASVSGWLNNWRMILGGAVMTSAPNLAASTTWIGWRTLATRISVAKS